MRKLCKEAMAAVGEYGRSTFMITMTANEHWPEVVAGGGTFDVLCRVFEWMSMQILNAIVNEEVLGPVDYYQWVTEVRAGLLVCPFVSTLTYYVAVISTRNVATLTNTSWCA